MGRRSTLSYTPDQGFLWDSLLILHVQSNMCRGDPQAAVENTEECLLHCNGNAASHGISRWNGNFLMIRFGFLLGHNLMDTQMNFTVFISSALPNIPTHTEESSCLQASGKHCKKARSFNGPNRWELKMMRINVAAICSDTLFGKHTFKVSA